MCSISTAAQLVLVLTSTNNSAEICAAVATQPSRQQAVGALAQLLTGLAAVVPAPMSFSYLRPPPDAECGAVRLWLQLSLGLLVPLSVQAVSESRLFARHEGKRQEAGLPPERGLDAAVLRAVWRHTNQGSAGCTAFLLWMHMSVVWRACSFWFMDAPHAQATAAC